MSVERKETRRGGRKAFRPAADNGLESRCLLSVASARFHPSVQVRPLGNFAQANRPAFNLATYMNHRPLYLVSPRVQPAVPHIQTANGGRSVVVTDNDGDRFQIEVTSTLPVLSTPTTGTSPQVNAGTVRAKRLPGGSVGLIVEGTTQNSELTINPIIKSPVRGGAHDFAHGFAGTDQVLDVGFVEVTSGQIGSILGFRTADLAGPITVLGDTPVDRIAFRSLEPGASIQVDNDLNTLDVLNGINLDGGPGIVVGRDLNFLNAGQDVRLDNGASIAVGRDLGRVPQVAQGTGMGGAGIILAGNLALGTDSRITVGRDLDNPVQVTGNLSGAANIPANVAARTIVLGTITA